MGYMMTIAVTRIDMLYCKQTNSTEGLVGQCVGKQ